MNVRRVVDERQVRRNFHRQAAEYDRHARVQERVALRLARLLESFPRPPGTILEVGCGTGLLSTRLACGSGERLLLSDLAHAMTRTAAGRLPGTPALDADARALPLREGCCSSLVSSSVYQWIDDLEGAFAEAWRVLRPGGLLAVALFGERTLYELRTAHRRAVARVGTARASHALEFCTLDEACQAAEGAGFVLEHAASSDEVEMHASVAELLRGLKGIGARNAAAGRPPGLASRRTMQAMMDDYRERFATAEGLPATYEVLYLVGRRP